MWLIIVLRKLAWSNTGTIASVTPDGLSINLRHLQCHPEDGRWALSKEVSVEQVTSTHRNQQLTHVRWSHPGNELAVLDQSGKVSIFNIAMAMNKVHLARPADADQEDDLGEIVGMQWLTSERAVSSRPRLVCFNHSIHPRSLFSSTRTEKMANGITRVNRGNPLGHSILGGLLLHASHERDS